MTVYLFMLLLQPVLAGLAWRFGRHWPRLAVGLMMGGGGFVLLLAVVSARPAWEAAIFPFLDYVKYQGFSLYLGAAVFFGATFARVGTRLDRAAIAVLGFTLVGYSGVANHWLLAGEVYGSDTFADAKLHCQESTIYTCGPAACVSALAHCGVSVTERQMAGLCLTNPTGTGIFNVYRGLTLALRGTAYRAVLRETPVEALMAKGSIAVLCLPGHAITVVGEGDRVLFHDPSAFAPGHWGLELLRKIYTGTAVILEPRPI